MNAQQRPISTVLHDIVGNIQEIVRCELRLAKTELANEFAKARHGGVLLGVGVLLLAFGAAFALLAVVYALSNVMPAWAAAASVAIGVAIIAAVCISLGLKRLKTVRAAPKTVSSLKENAEWTRQLMK